jgi:hypothetical protein
MVNGYFLPSARRALFAGCAVANGLFCPFPGLADWHQGIVLQQFFPLARLLQPTRRHSALHAAWESG